jgi:hypothetical protein
MGFEELFENNRKDYLNSKSIFLIIKTKLL